MRYITIPAPKLAECIRTLLDDPSAGIDEFAEWADDGPEVDVDRLESVAQQLRDEFDQFIAEGNTDLDLFEGRVGSELHRTLEEIEVDAVTLDAPGFWVGLTVKYFWWFVYRRQQSTFDTGDIGKYGKYVDGTNWSECVVLRSYLRGRLCHRPHDEDPYRLATAIEQGTDFWRSHVLRVQTSMSATLTQAFAAEQSTNRMATNELRQYARRLNRMWSNVVLHVYDDEECSDLISQIR